MFSKMWDEIGMLSKYHILGKYLLNIIFINHLHFLKHVIWHISTCVYAAENTRGCTMKMPWFNFFDITMRVSVSQIAFIRIIQIFVI